MTQVYVIEAVGLTGTRRHGPFDNHVDAAEQLEELEASGAIAWTETVEQALNRDPLDNDIPETMTAGGISRADWAALGDDDEG